MGFSGNRSVLISVTPTITAAAYTAGKQLGGVTKVPNVAANSGGGGTLVSIAVLDKANQKSALDVLLFNASPTLISSDTATFDISDAELVSKYLARVNVPSANYKTNGASTNADAVVGNIWEKVQASANALDLYIVLVSQGTPTYTSTTDLVLKLGFEQN
jgi:hypothetical protein